MSNKNPVDKSYFAEFSENLTTFVIESIFVGYATKERGGKPKQHFLQLLGLLFVKGCKIEAQENIKEKFGIVVLLWVTHIYHYLTKSAFEITLIKEVL